ncbi:FRG domain-containing protein [Lactonifactor longoviformis]|uniref:FRG domain-containing protein n=1 Tax=Lactonifactor longoviformis TaxID=341220 RepID=UPI00210A2970|nr:FRG domain-containing protein [Lactonifactor longoviformis]MCQ4671919.1 FRG domain-containing protein [Lactonifactor longoviformis]
MIDVETTRINSVEEYYQIVEKYKGNNLFRGQAVSEWDIVPGVFRGNCVKDKVAEECRKFSLVQTEEVLKKILELQHWGEKTRLCDLSINPSVSLYFVIEDDTQHDKDGAVFIIDRDKACNFNSVQLKILMRIAQGDLYNFRVIKNAVKNELHLYLSDEEIKEAITKNAVIDYDMGIAYSNPRAIIQGGTGIYFGYAFDCKDNLVEKGSLDIEGIIKKIIIPHDIKPQIIEHLNTIGIYGDLLYDKAKAVSNSRLSYDIQEFENRKKSFGQKVTLGVYVSELSFTDDDIQRIVDEVYIKYKTQYDKSARIWINVYHDLEDRRLTSSNWIARTIPDSNFTNYNLIFNENYRTSRMINLNKEISIFEIMRLTEPIVKECKQFLLEVERAYDLFQNRNIMRDKYGEVLKMAYIKRHKIIFVDLNDIEHGGERYDAYYEGAYNFCQSVYDLAWELCNDIGKGKQDSFLEWRYDKWHKECLRNYELYYLAARNLSI